MLTKTYDHCGRSHVGYLLAVVGFCLLTAAATVSAEDKTNVPQVKALPGIPEDFEIVYGTGATHAERGRTTYRISADGKATCEKTRGSRTAGTRKLEQYQLARGELQLIIKKISDAGFFNLREQYRNPRIMDGSSSYIRVTMDNKSHSVGVMNTSTPEFSGIANLVSTIIGKKKPLKTECYKGSQMMQTDSCF